MIAYRKSWLDEVGHSTFPETWDAFRDAGKKLKAKGRPIGQTAGHTFGDAPGWWYPYLWSWGGKEIEADGKTVVLNSKETVESIKFAVALWKETMDEGGLAWGRHQQQPRLPVANHQRHQQRRLDLHRGQEEARHLQDREGRADVAGHPARPYPQGAGWPVQPSGPVHRHADGLFEEPEGGQGLPALDPLQADLRPVVTSQQGYTSAPPRTGRSTRCGTSIRAEAVQGPAGVTAGWRAMPGRPTASPPRW
jgi:hypothetical protein